MKEAKNIEFKIIDTQSQEKLQEISMPFIDEELMIFSMVYLKLLKITKKENIFKGLKLKPCKKGNVIF